MMKVPVSKLEPVDSENPVGATNLFLDKQDKLESAYLE